MNKSNSIKSIAAGVAMIVTPVVVNGQTAEADSLKQVQSVESTNQVQLPECTASSFEYHITPKGADKGRINLFYGLPLKTEAFSFMEFYGEEGYFGKTMLHTPITKKGTGVRTEVKHHSFGPITAGIGIEQKMTLPGGIYASIKALPVVFDKHGYVKNQAIVGYFASKVIPINNRVSVNISSFLDFNIVGKNGPECDYGETDITAQIKTKYGQFDVGAGVNHNVSGKFAPDNQFRVRVGYHPKK